MAGTSFQPNNSGVNNYGFKSQPTNDNNPMANFLQSTQNLLAGQGSVNTSTGAGVAASGVAGMAPALDYLTKLTKGDQADVAQATQPQVNQIKDSFAAIRNLISSQPRGGGKSGALAESPFAQEKQIGDTQQTARSGAANSLGTMSATLAGLGLQQGQLGLGEESQAMNTALGQRGQNIGQTTKTIAAAFGDAASAGKLLFGGGDSSGD